MERPDRNSKDYFGQFGENEFEIDQANYIAELEATLALYETACNDFIITKDESLLLYNLNKIKSLYKRG
jgi:hypothetical protein